LDKASVPVAWELFCSLGTGGRLFMVELRPGRGYYRTLENYIIKNSPVIIKNHDILSKTSHLLSKIEIYYQTHYFVSVNTYCRIEHPPPTILPFYT
jgi:hypothetical protein